jgi:hypothetical protein
VVVADGSTSTPHDGQRRAVSSMACEQAGQIIAGLEPLVRTSWFLDFTCSGQFLIL